MIVFKFVPLEKQFFSCSTKYEDMTLADINCGSRHHTSWSVGSLTPFLSRRIELPNVLQEFKIGGVVTLLCLSPAANYIDAIVVAIVLADCQIERPSRSRPRWKFFPREVGSTGLLRKVQ